MNHAGKIDRIRKLLSFDQFFLSSNTQAASQACGTQIEFVFNATDTAQAGLARDLRLVGFDEAGRGALAGPVAVGCVQFNWNDICSPDGDFQDAILETYADLNDSKQVTIKNRQRLYEHIQKEAHCGLGFASAPEIDRFGIVKACSLAAYRAYNNLGLGSADIGLFDRGLSLGEEASEEIPITTQITKGDAKSFHIAAASILAKVARDDILCDMGTRAEKYGLARHKGYGSAAHIAAIRKHGPSGFHRRTFLTRVQRCG